MSPPASPDYEKIEMLGRILLLAGGTIAGVWAFVKWPLTLMLKASMREVLKDEEMQLSISRVMRLMLKDEAVQDALGRVLREKVLKPEVEQLRVAVDGAGDCAKQWAEISAHLTNLEDVAQQAIEVAYQNRSWMEDLSHALDVASGLDRRHGERRTVAFPLPSVLPDRWHVKRRKQNEED